MPEKGRLIRQMDLSSGLTVSFYDCSQAIVGNRSQVRLLVTVPVKVEPAKLKVEAEAQEALRRFLEEMGGNMEFQSSQTRNFIANEEVASLLLEMAEEFIRTNTGYLSHPDFSTRYILKRFAEWQRDGAIKRAHLEALRAHDHNE